MGRVQNMSIYDKNNRAIQGLDVDRHIKTHAVYNQHAPELAGCNEHLDLLEKCVVDANVKKGDDIPSSCQQIFSDVKNVCGLRRSLYTPYIKIRALHVEPMGGYGQV